VQNRRGPATVTGSCYQ